MIIPTFTELLNKAPLELQELIEECKKTPQSPKWHPEGDVFIHTKIVFERAREYGDYNLVLAAFFHDLGKVSTTSKNKKGEWASHGHEFVSAKIVEKHNVWITSLGGDWEQVYEIVNNHMRIKYINEMRPHKQKKLINNSWYEKLIKFTEFDDMSALN